MFKKIKRSMTLIISFVSLLLILLVFSGCTSRQRDKDTIKLMVIWNGISFINPEDQVNNRVAEVIREKTGVTLDVEFCETNETQKLTQVFSIGTNMPDIIMCPFWGGTLGEAGVIKDAAQSGLLLAWDDYWDMAPNIKDNFTVGVSKQFVEKELNAKEFGGKQYVMPIHCPATKEDTPNWGYTVFGRKDILEDLNVDPNSINTSEQLYELAVKIKNGNYKDVNGNPVIPAGNFQDGWDYSCYVNSYRYRQFTAIYEAYEGANLMWMSQTAELKQEVLFMRKMISQGLYDKEAFTQTTTQAQQKHINASYGLTAGHYTNLKNYLSESLYVSHPDKEYIPLGPIYDANGNPYMSDTYRFQGDSGGASMIITKDCRNIDAVMRYLNYINSDEGRYLTYLGIEGEDWTWQEDGRPRMTETYFENVKKDSKYGINRGIESIFIFGVSRLPRNNIYYAKEDEVDEYQNQLDEWYPFVFAPDDAIPATSWDEEFYDYDRLVDVLASMNYSDVVESAFFASSDSEALAKIDKYNASINKNALMDNYLRFVYEKVAEVRKAGKTVVF